MSTDRKDIDICSGLMSRYVVGMILHSEFVIYGIQGKHSCNVEYKTDGTRDFYYKREHLSGFTHRQSDSKYFLEVQPVLNQVLDSRSVYTTPDSYQR